MISKYDKAICRVMIYSYRGLENRCDTIDKALYNTAVRSAFKDTWETYKEMERLTREKVAYINVKVVIDQALIALKRKYEIEQYHIHGVSREQLAERLNTNLNTIDKRLARERAKLYEAILNRYSGEELLSIICDSEWLMNSYKREANQEPLNKQ